ncbi:D-2-hydroxyacid dehydrogenase [Rappaport israeli]|uniref:D-2-hydroxyacid dehydrogenase n=1 Tax=Rappaport israeli TaxID=1839807 RepID=UPI0009319FE3|nr:D-2-hydroxyacid dehydrogenase [Rappaport israeli]
MRAVFLDRNTFSPDIDLPAPKGITDWVVHESTDNQPEAVINALKNAEIAVLNKIVINDAVLKELPQLKLVQITATGKDNVDLQACEQQGVTVQNVAGYSTTSVTEHTLMLILSCMRSLVHYHQLIADGGWQEDGRFSLNTPEPTDIKGKTLGIIGAGTIGKSVAELAKAFGMKVLLAERQGEKPRDTTYTPFKEVLAESDVISLHCPLTDKTKGLINRQTIDFMKNKPLLINVARGALVESQAVVDALNQNKLLGYGCDVFTPEPPAKDEPLLSLTQHPRVIMTPHNAWASAQAQQKLWRILSENVEKWIKTQG